MQRRVYIETTIPSYYYTLRTDNESLVKQRVTQNWWNQYGDQFILTTSRLSTLILRVNIAIRRSLLLNIALSL